MPDPLRILAIDTATEACSAALYLDGVITSRFEISPQGHSELILPMCDQLLEEANITVSQLTAIADDRGPGSFTGLRIGLAFAKGLALARIGIGVTQGIAFAADIPVVLVSSLEALACRAFRESGHSHVLCAIDARMREVYWGRFVCNETGCELIGSETVGPPQSLEPVIADKWVAAGTGWSAYNDELSALIAPESVLDVFGDMLPHAQDIATLGARAYQQGRFVAAEEALPVYLRDNVAHKPGGK